MNRTPLFRKRLVRTVIIMLFLISILPSVGSLSREYNTKDMLLQQNKVLYNNDTTPPVTTISFIPPEPTSPNGWYMYASFVLNATDDSSGVYTTRYRIGAGPWKYYLLQVNIVASDKDLVIEYFSIDAAGNIEPVKNATINIDLLPPLINLNCTWEKIGDNRYVIIVVADCYDGLSGMQKVEFYLNGDLNGTVTGPGPEYVWTCDYEPGVTTWIKAVAYDNVGWTAEYTIIFPYSTQSRSSQKVIYLLPFQQCNNFFYNLITRGEIWINAH
ncbi:MAG: hypothetical protein JW840_03595 [Candidatus Thermoplasmatota archaeon]|nr:hypothetical protein [Candidatus Thermoplasmatota archaeon]